MRLWTRALIIAGLAVLPGMWPAAPADAHAVLVATTPQAGYTSLHASQRIVLTFDEPVGNPSVRLTRSGQEVSLRTAHLIRGARQATVAPARPLANGSYTVRWQVTAGDGDVVTGSFGFGIGAPAPAGSQISGTAGLPAAIVLRWLLFTGLALVVGGLTSEWVLQFRGVDLPRPDPPLRVGAVLGFLAAIGLAAHLMGSGNLLEGLLHPRPELLLTTSAGRVALTELAAFAVTAGIAFSRTRRPVLFIPVLAVLIAEGLRSHLHGRGGGLGVLVVAVHLAAAAIWVGALLHVVRVGYAWRRRRVALRELIRTYARLAMWMFLLVVGTGTAAAIVLLPSLGSLVRTGYGKTLMVKLALVITTAGLALIARHSVPDMPERQPRRRWPVMRAEGGVLVAVLAATAALVSLPLPATRAAPAAAPPPPAGPVVAVGTLAGQITLAAQASAGQLLVRLSVPGDDAVDQDAAGAKYTVTVRRADRSVPSRSCGPGCFLARSIWRAGDNPVRLDVAATGWHGATVTVHIPWPPRPDNLILGRVIAAMRAAPQLVNAEQVTSDTTRPTPPEGPLRLSGAAFIATEPYGTGGPAANLIPGPTGRTRRLMLAYPAQGYYLDLIIDPADRIVAETISAPGHLINRRFHYPHR